MKTRTLHTILDGFQKPELQDFASLLGRELSPRLRKSQLVEQMDSYLRAEPVRWMSHLLERDARLLRELVHAGPDKVQYQDFAEYPSLLEVAGLVQFDDSDEHYHKVWISREVYDIVSPEIEHVIRSGEKSGQYEVERIGLGYLNLYGILPTDTFVELIADWYEQTHTAPDYRELSRMLHQSPLVKMYRYTDHWGDYVCSPCVENIDEVFTRRHELKQRHFPPMELAQVREAGSGAPYFTVGMKTREGMRLEQMYRRVGYEGFELVKAEHDTWMEAQYTDGSNEELYQPLSDSPLAMELDDDSWKACCEIVAEYADSIPRWILCGETAAHTGLCKARWNDDQVQEAQAAAAVKFLPEGLAIPHVAADAPCPCGSGLRYCHCHGKYLS